MTSKSEVRAISFGDAERTAVSDLMNDALARHGWTQTKAAEMAGVDKSHISVLTRTIPNGVSAGYLFQSFIGVDVPPIEVVKAMGITGHVEKHLADPVDQKEYPNMKKILGKVTDEGMDPMTALLQQVSAPKRALARQLIRGILETINQ